MKHHPSTCCAARGLHGSHPWRRFFLAGAFAAAVLMLAAWSRSNWGVDRSPTTRTTTAPTITTPPA